jgi:hypothetical protein
MNGNFLPPPSPSADAIQAAHSLLAIVADPRGAKQRLDDLVAAHDQLKQAHAALEVERRKLIDENARAADLKAKETLLAQKQSDLEKFATANNVAAAALQDREQKLAMAEAAAKEREGALTRRETDLAKKLESYRQALA